ncbi:hypothetical protein HDU96_009708 [Phlyctochytrium bullatum]|nr:hypothetical protein HDU96_009708 [Phlyctochytrium bullatum]
MENTNEDDYKPYVPVKVRLQEKRHRLSQARKIIEKHAQAHKSDDEEVHAAGPRAQVSLIDQTVEIKKYEKPKSKVELELEELNKIEKAQTKTKALASAFELANDIKYTEPMKST